MSETPQERPDFEDDFEEPDLLPDLDPIEDDDFEEPLELTEQVEEPITTFDLPLEAPMSTPQTDLAFSYEYGADIDLAYPSDDGTETPEWQPVRFPSEIKPTVDPVTVDAATYDDLGSPNEEKTSESWSIAWDIQARRIKAGGFLPEVEKLRTLTEPDATGSKAIGHFRWYDKPSDPAAKPSDEAYEGYGTVKMERKNTGNADLGAWTVTVTGKGRRKKIPNPMAPTTP